MDHSEEIEWGGIQIEKFDIRKEIRSRYFNQIWIIDLEEEKYLIKKFRLKI
jgi:hypothetical protein